MGKRLILLTWLLALSLLLCACGEKPEPVTVYEKDGYTVDTEAQTITKGSDVIFYSFSVGSGDVTFTYPDGSSACWNNNEFGGTVSIDFDFDKWPSAMELIDVLDYDPPDQKRSNGNPLGLLLIPLGILQAVFPQAFWFLNHGWRYKDAEPSELALGLGRAGGVVIAIIGLFMLF